MRAYDAQLSTSKRRHGNLAGYFLATANIIRKILDVYKQGRTISSRSREDHLGPLDPALRAAALALLRARRDLHVAQAERLARDVIFDLLLDGQLLAVPPV